FLTLPSPAQKVKLDELLSAIKAKEDALSEKEIAPVQEKWEQSLVGRIAASPRNGLIAHYELNGSFSDGAGRYQHGRTVSGDPTFGSGQVGRSVSFDGDSHVSFGNMGPSGPS